MPTGIQFAGPHQYRLRSLAELNRSILETSYRRLLRGPAHRGWNWALEVGTQFLRRQVRAALEMKDVSEARSFLDSVVIRLPACDAVNIVQTVQDEVSGRWFTPQNSPDGLTLLYFHGGGYSFYPASYINFIALIASATNSRLFAPDYRLAPEHRFPSQLDDALNAYRWMLSQQIDPSRIIIAGDSAGGHLALTLLLAIRENSLAMPRLAVALSPPTDFRIEQFRAAEPEADWITREMLVQWADWFCDRSQRQDPRVSPVLADLHGLCPIYIQAGGAEVLFSNIESFISHARAQNAESMFDVWPDMNHDFQMYGPYLPQAAESMNRLGEIVGRLASTSIATGSPR